MIKRLCQHLYFLKWYAQIRFLRKRKPLQTVLFISDLCNLRCKHCCIYNDHNPNIKSYDTIASELERVYRMGSRFVDFEGGEPFLWKDGNRNVNDLFDLARDMGFFSTTVTTNAQISFEPCCSDLVWVSLDGLGKYHDAIRGDGAFAKLEKNVDLSSHPYLNANMVINRLNWQSVEETIQYVADSPKFHLISLNFHTPFPGTESLELDWETRCKVIDRILELRKKGAPLMNTAGGLRRMKNLDFAKKCWIANFVMTDGSFHEQCQGQEAGVCDRCGFGMAGEMKGVYDLRLETILAGLKVRM